MSKKFRQLLMLIEFHEDKADADFRVMPVDEVQRKWRDPEKSPLVKALDGTSLADASPGARSLFAGLVLRHIDESATFYRIVCHA
jgi:hypothetical protein